MNLIEYRIKQFRELNDNKWFHRMNYILDILKTNKNDRYILMNYGSGFYYS
jgi:hypothetical protein